MAITLSHSDQLSTSSTELCDASRRRRFEKGTIQSLLQLVLDLVTKMEEGSFPVWKGDDGMRVAAPSLVAHMHSAAGLFDWSMKFQDGTKPTGTVNPEDFTPERRAWLADALKYYMQAFAVRECKRLVDAWVVPTCHLM